jgi:TolB protein
MDPALSPDGQWVAFTRWNGQQSGITGSLWVINVNGSSERQIVSGVHQPKSPTWSADGQRIIMNMQQDGTVDNLWVCMIDGKPVEVEDPIEGERCMQQKADPFWGLLVVNVASGAYENLPRDAHSFAPTWDSVSAWHVVYRGDRGLMNLDLNQNTTWLLKSGGAYRGPVISPDGTKIATTYKQANNWEVHVMNVDGSGEVRLTQTPMTVIIEQELQGKTARVWNNAAPAWSPDGSQIAFITDRNGSYEIWVMNADGSGQHPILTADALGGLNIKYDGVDERVITWR